MALSSLIARLTGDRRGGVSIIGALTLTSVIGMAAFGVEATQGYAMKVSNQRIADAAALAAAMAYQKGVMDNYTTPNSVVLASLPQPAAAAVAAANGLAASTVAASIPSTNVQDGQHQVTTIKVTVTTPVKLQLARVISSNVSYSVGSTGYAEVRVLPGTQGSSTPATPTNTVLPGCLFALSNNAQRGVSISGSATMLATDCNVESNRLLQVEGSAKLHAGQIKVNGNIDGAWSTEIFAQEITASGTFIDPKGAQNPSAGAIRAQPDATKKYSGRAVTVADPLAGNANLAAALARTTQAANFPQPTAPANPVLTAVSNSYAWRFSGSTGTGTGVQASWYSGGKWTIPAGDYNLYSLTVEGNTVVEFAAPPASPAAYAPNDANRNYVNDVTVTTGLVVSGSSRLSVLHNPSLPAITPSTNWIILGGVSVQGSGNGRNINTSSTWGAEFGNGTYRFGGTIFFGPRTSFGAGAVTLNGNTTINGSGALIMGAGTHIFGGQLNVGGSATLTLGDGNMTIVNDFVIGGSTNVSIGAGNIAIGQDTSSRSIIADGSATIAFSGTSLSNTFTTSGSITTGGSGTFTFPTATNHFIGGTMNLNGGIRLAPPATSGSGTFTAGAYTIRGNLNKTASLDMKGTNVSIFASGIMTWGGASTGQLAAPMSTTLEAGDALVGILFASTNAGAVTFNGSANNTYTGLLHMPNAVTALNGAASVTGCFGIVASTITITGSASAATQCSNVGSNGHANNQQQAQTTQPTPPVVSVKLVK